MARTKKCPDCGAKMEWDEEEQQFFCNECGEIYDPEDDEGEGYLRRMEAYAAYQYAGCTDAFFEDEAFIGGPDCW